MIDIKITSGDPRYNGLALRQFPLGIAEWGDCRFHINSDIESVDWWFILHGSSLQQTQNLLCDPQNIVFVSMEPYEFYPPAFYNQFSKLILCDKSIKHPSIIYKNLITWWAGISVEFDNGHVFNPLYRFNYRDLKALKAPNKQNRISVITSTNNAFPGHKARLDFIDILKSSHLSSSIDFFGGGHNPIPDKLDALLSYKYHICLENSVIENYWTEKIADSYLGFALPIYYGCPNIQEYFPANSYIPIDILRASDAVETISMALQNDEYSKRINSIISARELVLDDYNIFNEISAVATSKARRLNECTVKPVFEFKHLPSTPPTLFMRSKKKIRRIIAKFLELV